MTCANTHATFRNFCICNSSARVAFTVGELSEMTTNSLDKTPIKPRQNHYKSKRGKRTKKKEEPLDSGSSDSFPNKALQLSEFIYEASQFRFEVGSLVVVNNVTLSQFVEH